MVFRDTVVNKTGKLFYTIILVFFSFLQHSYFLFSINVIFTRHLSVNKAHEQTFVTNNLDRNNFVTRSQVNT